MKEKVLTIDINFPEFYSKEITSSELFQIHYELFTCREVLNYIKSNYPELYLYMFELDSDDIQKRFEAFETRNTLGNYAKRFEITEELKFAIYSLVNNLKNELKEYLNLDEVRLNYNRKHFCMNDERKYFNEFTHHEEDVEDTVTLGLEKNTQE